MPLRNLRYSSGRMLQKQIQIQIQIQRVNGHKYRGTGKDNLLGLNSALQTHDQTTHHAHSRVSASGWSATQTTTNCCAPTGSAQRACSANSNQQAQHCAPAGASSQACRTRSRGRACRPARHPFCRAPQTRRYPAGPGVSGHMHTPRSATTIRRGPRGRSCGQGSEYKGSGRSKNTARHNPPAGKLGPGRAARGDGARWGVML